MLPNLHTRFSPMKSRLIAAVLAATFFFLRPCLANNASAAPADVKQELNQLVTQINTKLKAGHRTEADLAPELKQFDALLAKHQGEKTDDVAQILLMKAMLYVQVFGDTPKGEELIRRLKADFPETTQGKGADRMLALLERQQEAQKIQATLAVGAKFPDFQEKDLAGKPLTLSSHEGKGKVVLVDFWATWCAPCVAELPNVLAAYKQYHGKGFDIVGVSLDQDQGKLAAFMKEHGVTWDQYFDGKGWDNQLALKYGVESIPATYLLDGDGLIVAKDLRGEALATELAKRLGKN
jgi:peroxiredoxin